MKCSNKSTEKIIHGLNDTPVIQRVNDSIIFGINMFLNPHCLVLGLDSGYEWKYRCILRFAILQKWLDKEPPDIKTWFDKLMSILERN